MEESWVEKTERLEREYEARIGKLSEELRGMQSQLDCGQDGPCAKSPGCNRHWEERNGELVREVRALQSKLEAKAKRVAELEEEIRRRAELYTSNETVLRQMCDDLQRHIRNLQSQLAWTPVSAGLPTEPGYYLFTNKEHDVALYRQNRTLTNWKWETVQGVKRKDDAMEEAWSAYRRIELPKDGEA